MVDNNNEINDLLYEIDDKGQRVLVRSVESNLKAYLRFSNRTTRPVDVWWRDFQGVKRHYMRLNPGKHYDVDTYVTHPWEFSDAATEARYVVNNNPVYRAPQNIGGMMYRTNWNITVSVMTLRTTAMLAFAKTVTEPSQVEQLEIPRTLVVELKQLVETLQRPLPPTY